MSISLSADTRPVPSAAHGALLGEGAVLVWNDVAAIGREQFYQWHDKEHIPERLAIPGFRRGRRYIRPGHSPEWLTLYEADNVGVMISPEYMRRLNSPTPATTSTLRYFQNTSRAVCSIVHSVGSSSGGHVLALRMKVPAESTQAMCEKLNSQAFPRIYALTGIVACHLFAADQNASFLNTAESSTREFDVPSWVVLVEATTSVAAEHAWTLISELQLEQLGAVIRQDAAVYALEICRLSSPNIAT